MSLQNDDEREPLLSGHGRGHATQWPSTEQIEHSTNRPDDTADEDERSQSYSSGLVLKLGASMFDFSLTGCSMAALGALIPNVGNTISLSFEVRAKATSQIEQHYETSDGVTAFIFAAGMIGYVCATASVDTISTRFGRKGVALITPISRLLAALVLAIGPPFAIVLAAYICFGFGTGLCDTAWNAWASSVHRPNVSQGLLHGSFSLGCIMGPIIAVAVLEHHSWNGFYLIIASLSCVELITQGWAFRRDTAPPPHQPPHPTESDTDPAKPQSLLRQPVIWLFGAFYFFYQGVELIFTGWIVVFMLRVRHADNTVAGLASSLFWIGMAVGRYTLGPVTERFRVARSVAVYITFALCCQIMLNVASEVAVTMVLLAANGFFAAPLFPSGIVLLVSRLPSSIRIRGVAFLIALGQVGGALSTLAVGFMADTLGIRHLFLVMCGMSAAMLILWIIIVRLG